MLYFGFCVYTFAVTVAFTPSKTHRLVSICWSRLHQLTGSYVPTDFISQYSTTAQEGSAHSLIYSPVLVPSLALVHRQDLHHPPVADTICF